MLRISIVYVFNCHVEVSENDGTVRFLHKISSGGTSDSYGIEVARLAGLPEAVLKRSKSILSELERIGKFKVMGNTEETPGGGTQLSSAAIPGQESFFNPENVIYQKEDKIRGMIRNLDVSRLTPIEAMNMLFELQRKAKG